MVSSVLAGLSPAQRDELRAQQQSVALDAQSKALRVERAIGEILDNKDVAERVARDLGSSVRVDRNIANDPELLLGLSNALAKEFDLPDLALTNADLIASPLTKDSALMTDEERGAQAVGRTAGAISASQKVTEARGAIETGDESSPAVAAFQGSLEASEESSGLDLSPGIMPDDLDTGAGARAFAIAALSADDGMARTGQVQPGDSILGSLFRSEVGKRIVDELNDIEPDEQGKLWFGGDQGFVEGIAPEAVALYMEMIREGAKRSQRGEASFMAEIGLGKFTGLSFADTASGNASE